MTKQEISEIKKLLTQKKCSITRICGCYVDGEKNKKTEFKQAFLALPEEEMFKYFEILRKTLSGTLGKNMLTLLEEYFDKIIANYEFVGNYLILLIHDAYDVPGKTSDGIEMEDASDEVYEYILSCICPVELSKPGLSYNAAENIFQNRVRDWIVTLPETGFLFPAFTDRCSDIHSVLYYSKDPEELNENFVEQLLGCPLPLSAGGQLETFQMIIEETLGDDCNIETVKNIHDKLTTMAEEYKEDPAPVVLAKKEVKTILADSGVANKKLEEFDRHYDETAGENTSLLMSNVMNTRSFEVKTPDVVIKVKPERTDLIETRNLEGRECLVIQLGGDVVVNGITIRASGESAEEDEA